MRDNVWRISLEGMFDIRKVFLDFLRVSRDNWRNTGIRVQWRVKAVRWARQSTSNSLIGWVKSDWFVAFVKRTLIVTSSPWSSPQLCNHVSFSESGQRSSSTFPDWGLDRSNWRLVDRFWLLPMILFGNREIHRIARWSRKGRRKEQRERCDSGHWRADYSHRVDQSSYWKITTKPIDMQLKGKGK